MVKFCSALRHVLLFLLTYLSDEGAALSFVARLRYHSQTGPRSDGFARRCATSHDNYQGYGDLACHMGGSGKRALRLNM